MRETTPIRLGDSVTLRKPHACGANRWTVTRVGADVRVQCDECGRSVLMPRPRFLRAVRKLERGTADGPEPPDAGRPG
jgi:hypothetical protein